MSKKKWKVYTTDELRDRFQPKYAKNKEAETRQAPSTSTTSQPKRRYSAPPGMIHFPPGSLSSRPGSGSDREDSPDPNRVLQHNVMRSIAQQPVEKKQEEDIIVGHTEPQQHDLITHMAAKNRRSPVSTPYTNRRVSRRSSLPHLFTALQEQEQANNAPDRETPGLDKYLPHLQHLPPSKGDLQSEDENIRKNFTESVKLYLTTTPEERQLLPSFSMLLQTIREEDNDFTNQGMNVEPPSLPSVNSVDISPKQRMSIAQLMS
eukprot:TRINITY_DN2945_c0_g1_i1.p1 TRINITY_DN2945_c0_g1~~TRINITY_DN2945_c0_g1_i1.p1  ORF type:complete len:262 (-),score=62.50 TRINITY_DN2945_c0_g1_i1:53-838(-)